MFPIQKYVTEICELLIHDKSYPRYSNWDTKFCQMGHFNVSAYDDEYSFTLIQDESAGAQQESEGKDEHTWSPWAMSTVKR